MENYNIEILLDNIFSIINKKTNEEIELNKIKIDNIVDNYSNTKVPIYRFLYNNVIIKKNNDYQVKYKCIKCDSIRDTLLNNVLRKINKNIVRCYICKELEECKRQNQSKFMVDTYKNHGKIISKIRENKNITLLEKLRIDNEIFMNYDDDFKENYFKRNLTYEEFEYLRPKILSIQNKKFVLDSDLVYYPTVSISNQTRFCSYLYSLSRNSLEKIHNIILKCDNCETLFISKNLHSHKNRIKSFCTDCNLTNNIFKIRCYNNIANEKILYQSKFELKFIRYCNENKIYLINGPKINYIFNNNIKTYRIDFAIEKIKTLIEIKDNHCWHLDNLNSGKWDAKVEGVKKFIEEQDEYNNFIIIFPKSYVKITKEILESYYL